MNNSKKPRTRVSFVIKSKEVDGKHRFGINSLKLDKSHKRLFTAGRDAIIRKWDVSAEKPVYEESFEHHTDWVNDIVLCERANVVVSASSDTTVKVWKADQGICTTTLRKHEDYVRCLAYAPDAGRFASAGFDKKVHVWDLESISSASTPVVSLDGPKQSIYSLDITRNGSLVLAGTSENLVRLWDGRRGGKVCKLKGHADNIKAVRISADGALCLSCSSDGTIKLWDIGQQRCISTYDVHDDSVWSMLVNEAFTKVWTGGRDGRICETDLVTSDSWLLAQEKNSILRLEFGLEPQSMWASTTDPDIHLWSWANASAGNAEPAGACSGMEVDQIAAAATPMVVEPVTTIQGEPGIVRYQVLNNRRHILTADSRGHVALWDVLTACHVCDCGTVDFEEELQRRNDQACIPSWFGVEIKTGVLTINLDPSQCFAAETYKCDAGLGPESDDEKSMCGHGVNLGHLLLKRLFQPWRETSEDPLLRPAEPLSHSQGSQPLQPDPPAPMPAISDISPIADHTAVIFSDESQGTGLALLRVLVSDMSTTQGDQYLRSIAPAWVTDCVFKDIYKTREAPKLHFLLNPQPTASQLPSLPQGNRLSAGRILRVKRIARYICDKLANIQGAEELTKGLQNDSAAPEDLLDLICNDQVLPGHMTLGAIKQFLWKGGDEIIIQYRIKLKP